MEEQEQKEQKIKEHAHRVFNILEKPMMEFIANYLEAPEEKVFVDKIPPISEPIILNPVDEKEEYLHLIWNCDSHDTTTNLKEYVHHSSVKQSIGFLLQSAEMVYGSLIARGLQDEYRKQLQNFVLSFDENTLSFKLMFQSEQERKIIILNKYASELVKKMQDRKYDEHKQDITTKIHQTSASLNKIKQELTDEIKLKNKENRLAGDKKIRLTLTVSKLTKEEADSLHDSLIQPNSE